MDALRWLIEIFNAYLPVGGGGLLVREVVGNLFGLASALGGMRRKIWAWPVGIIGNVLLLTVFLGGYFSDAATATLLGQAGRQIMFIAVAVYGWRQWRAARAERIQHDDGAVAGHAVTPSWASGPQRLGLAVVLLLGTVALTPVFTALGSYEPVWADAWTFVGSLLATYGMAKGWVEFWLVWVAVDIVGVPLLFSAGYYASAFMYLSYGVFTLIGFFVWWRAEKQEKPRIETRLPDPRLQDSSAASTRSGGGDDR